MVGCPYHAAYASHGDAAAFAAAYVPTLRSWSETVFHGGLDPARPLAERQAIVDRTGAQAEAVDLSPVEALFVAKRAYLMTAMETIDQEYGSFEAYVKDGLGMSPEAQKAFQESMLE